LNKNLTLNCSFQRKNIVQSLLCTQNISLKTTIPVFETGKEPPIDGIWISQEEIIVH
jgi:hypothetical protein